MKNVFVMAIVISTFSILSYSMNPDYKKPELSRQLSLHEPMPPITLPIKEYISRHPSINLTDEGYPKSLPNPEITEEKSHRSHHTEIHRTMSVADGQIKIDVMKDSDEDIKNLVTKRTLYLSNIGTGVVSLLLGAGISIAIKFGYCK